MWCSCGLSFFTVPARFFEKNPPQLVRVNLGMPNNVRQKKTLGSTGLLLYDCIGGNGERLSVLRKCTCVQLLQAHWEHIQRSPAQRQEDFDFQQSSLTWKPMRKGSLLNYCHLDHLDTQCSSEPSNSFHVLEPLFRSVPVMTKEAATLRITLSKCWPSME